MATPTTRIVTTSADNGPGSLKDVISQASSGDTITFATTIHNITLTSGQIVIDKNLTINGPGADQLIISGNGASRVFGIAENTTVAIDRISIENGFAVGGGAIYNDGIGTLTITNSTLSGNAGGDFGGAIFNAGTLNVVFSHNY